jgi:hypothetical protein
MVHQTIALSGAESEQERNPLSISKTVPEKRLEIRLGKFSAADFFDTNSVGSDGHLQFTNWTVVNNGAYDYAADTRGYTYGAILEYQQPRFGVRFGEMLMLKVANGIDLDWDLRRAHAENLEFEIRPSILASQKTTIRALSYFNTANMGDYREAVVAFLRDIDPKPDIQAHRHQGSLKYGLGLNIEQTLPANFRAFATGNDSQQPMLPYDDFAANGNNPLNSVSQLKGALQRCPLRSERHAFRSVFMLVRALGHAFYLRH